MDTPKSAVADPPNARTSPDLAMAQLLAAYLKRFHALRDTWKQATRFLSSGTKLESHPAYREIIEMGWPVVPILMRELRTEPDWWFGALREITGENPMKPEHAGRLTERTKDWIEWGERRGYI